MAKRKWPTVSQVLNHADEVVIRPSGAYYLDRVTAGGAELKIRIHKATISNLIKALHGAGWTMRENMCFETWERPQ